ncbi:(2Fe-2S)-binding protein [Motiliproteus sediminis]|uniref:(2Fe-2S)-binding protein n=1 Tax=Motiliproteus sediminis TaxID=1468178 RepID=UPI001AEFE2B7|nr:(2Fe-2S)-binding protein [Motiliproteus sediminis]
MYVCVCKEVTDSQLQQVVVEGADNLRQASRCTGLGTQCGKCFCFARERIEHHRAHASRQDSRVA